MRVHNLVFNNTHIQKKSMKRKEVEFVDRSFLETKWRGRMDNWLLGQSSMEGEERVMREKMLYDASLSGSVESLNKLMQKDQLTLDRVFWITCFNETPLHVAAMKNHQDFAKVLLNYKQDLVRELDSHRRSPLHLASANGYVEMVKLLLMADSDVCLIRDEDGRTPLHLAIMKDRDEVVNELVRARSEVTQYTLDRGETILHTCVIYNRLNALKRLVEFIEIDDFVNIKDDNGNTILHTAAALKQIETMKYLIDIIGVTVNAVNRNGFTALDIIEHLPRDFKSKVIRELLVTAGALPTRNVPETAHDNHQVTRQVNENEILSLLSIDVAQPSSLTNRKTKKPTWFKKKCKSLNKHLKKKHTWVKTKRDALMVAATVIAAMAYQAGLNPPGSVWQDDHDTTLKNGTKVHVVPGTSIMALLDPAGSDFFWGFNTLSFVSSLSIVFLLVSGIPMRLRIFMWFLMVAMWMTLTSMIVTYLISMGAITQTFTAVTNLISRVTFRAIEVDLLTIISAKKDIIIYIIDASVILWLFIILVVLLVHTCRFIVWIIWMVIRIVRMVIRKCRKRKVSRNANEGAGHAVSNV